MDEDVIRRYVEHQGMQDSGQTRGELDHIESGKFKFVITGSFAALEPRDLCSCAFLYCAIIYPCRKCCAKGHYWPIVAGCCYGVKAWRLALITRS